MRKIAVIVAIVIGLFATNAVQADECVHIKDHQIRLACTLQKLRMQMPKMPREKAPPEPEREDSFYMKEIYDYVFRPCALRDAMRIKGSKSVDDAVDMVISAFHVDQIESALETVRGQTWHERVILYYTLLHVCLMTQRDKP